MDTIYGVHLTTSNTVEVETKVVDKDAPHHLVLVTLEVIKNTTPREASDNNKITVHRKCALLIEQILRRTHGRNGKPLTTTERIEMESFMGEYLDVCDENGVPYLSMVAHQSGRLVRKETLGLNPFTSAVEPVLSPELDHNTLTWKNGADTDVDRLQAYHYDSESGTGFLATVLSVPLHPGELGRLQARIRLRGVCSSVTLLRADIRRNFKMEPCQIMSPKWIEALGSFALKRNQTFNRLFKQFCKHGGLRFVGLQFLNNEEFALNQVLYHKGKAVMRRTGRGNKAYWCSSEGYSLDWDITKPLYRMTNSTDNPLFVDPTTFKIQVADESETIANLRRRYGVKLSNASGLTREQALNKYYTAQINAAEERSWTSLSTVCNGRQWLGPDLFVGEDGLAKGHLNEEDESTYQAMLVAAILETSGFAPHDETLYLKRTLLQEREFPTPNKKTNTRCAYVQSSSGMTRVEVLPDIEHHKRQRSFVAYEGKPVSHFRELDGVPYNWTFSQGDKKEEEYTWFPYHYKETGESRLTIGCGASFSTPSGAQRFLHRRAFPMASKGTFSMKNVPSNDSAKDWCDGMTPTTGIFSGPVGFHLRNTGVGGGKEDAEAVERLFKRAIESTLEDTTSNSIATVDYSTDQQAAIDRWSKAKCEALKKIRDLRLTGFSTRFRECHMYTVPAVELSAASLTLTRTDEKESQTDYPTLFLGPSTYAASQDGTFVGGRPHDYRHPGVEMEGAEPLFMDVVYHGRDGPTAKINGSRALGAHTLAPNTDVLVRSETGKTVTQGKGDKKKVVGRFQRGVFLQRHGERITVKVGNDTMSVPQEDVRVLYRVTQTAKRFVPMVRANEINDQLSNYSPLKEKELKEKCVELYDKTFNSKHRYKNDHERPPNYNNAPEETKERIEDWVKKDHLVRSTAVSDHLKRNKWPLKEGRTRKKADRVIGKKGGVKYHTLKARPANAMQREMTRWLCFDNSLPVWDEPLPEPQPASPRRKRPASDIGSNQSDLDDEQQLLNEVDENNGCSYSSDCSGATRSTRQPKKKKTRNSVRI